jgi:hypothetical protein
MTKAVKKAAMASTLAAQWAVQTVVYLVEGTVVPTELTSDRN